mgnify:CR=1 FL=1
MKNKKTLAKKAEHYSYLKMALRFVTLAIALWALVVAYQAKYKADWVEKLQNTFIFRSDDEG